MKEIVMDLSCELCEAEVNDRAQQLSSTVVRRDEVDTEKRNATKGYNERLAELEGSIRSLSKVIRERAEWRPVTCAVQFHKPAQGSKRIVRKDTGEIVRDEPMSSFEHQNNLFEEVEAEIAAVDHALTEMLDGMSEPLREGVVTGLSVSIAGQTYEVDKAAAERIHARAKKKRGEVKADGPNGFDDGGAR